MDMRTEELILSLASCSIQESSVGGAHCPRKIIELTLIAGVADELAQG